MFAAYFDQSRGPKPDVIAVAGFIATVEQWQHFDRNWGEFLQDEAISMFHMTDYECREGEFKDWDNDRRLHSIKRALTLIHTRTNVSISAGLVLDEYDKVIEQHPIAKEEFSNPFALCVNGCLRLIVDWLEEFHKGELVEYFFECGDPGMGKVGEVFDEISKNPHLKAGCGFNGLTFGDKRKYFPLQAADINAYECRKQLINQIIPDVPMRPVRKSMWNLAEHPHRDRCFTYDEMIGLAEKAERKKALES